MDENMNINNTEEEVEVNTVVPAEEADEPENESTGFSLTTKAIIGGLCVYGAYKLGKKVVSKLKPVGKAVKGWVSKKSEPIVVEPTPVDEDEVTDGHEEETEEQ